MRDHLPIGATVFIDLIIAIACILAVGVITNVIAELATK